MEHAVPVVVSVTTFLLSLHQFHLWIMPSHFLHRILSCPLKTDCLDVLLRVRILQYGVYQQIVCTLHGTEHDIHIKLLHLRSQIIADKGS